MVFTVEYSLLFYMCFVKVTTFSRLLTVADIKQLKQKTGIYNIGHLSLQQFETEFSFLKKIRYKITPQ